MSAKCCIPHGGSAMGGHTPVRIFTTFAAISATLVMTGCTGAKHTLAAAGGRDGTAAAAGVALPTLTIRPAANAQKLPISTEISMSVVNGTIRSVTLVSASGGQVAGSMRPDGTSWVPAVPLQYGQTYTAQVTAVGPAGRTKVGTTSFTTMKQPATRPVQVSINLVDGQTYGVGMPIVIDFGAPIPVGRRADRQPGDRQGPDGRRGDRPGPGVQGHRLDPHDDRDQWRQGGPPVPDQ